MTGQVHVGFLARSDPFPVNCRFPFIPLSSSQVELVDSIHLRVFALISIAVIVADIVDTWVTFQHCWHSRRVFDFLCWHKCTFRRPDKYGFCASKIERQSYPTPTPPLPDVIASYVHDSCGSSRHVKLLFVLLWCWLPCSKRSGRQRELCLPVSLFASPTALAFLRRHLLLKSPDVRNLVSPRFSHPALKMGWPQHEAAPASNLLLDSRGVYVACGRARW